MDGLLSWAREFASAMITARTLEDDIMLLIWLSLMWSLVVILKILCHTTDKGEWSKAMTLF